MSRHILIARTEGAKAGFNAYMATKVHTAAARQAEIRSAGNKKAQFNAYCAIFGDQFGTVNGNGAVRSNEQVDDARDSVLAALQGDPEATIQKLARLLGRKAPVVQGRRSVGVQVFDQEADDEVTTVDASADGGILSRIAAASAPVAPAKKAAPKVEREIVATRISFPMAMSIRGFCTKQGWEFEITDKTGKGSTADYTVVVNGVALSPVEASEIIAVAKGK